MIIFIFIFTLISRNLSQSLEIAGENSIHIESAINYFDGENKDNLIWVINNLPEIDLASVDSILLINTIIYPDSAKNKFSWSEDIPIDIWRKYVLFPRLSQEPLEDYRPFFFHLCKDLLDTCSTMESAINTLHNWATNTVKFKQTQRRDQGPFESYISGFGRCEELMIFNASACRSFGIPIRQAFAPYWAFTDNNHAWSEIYLNGKWEYIGVSGQTQINKAWFTEGTKRTPLICAIAVDSDNDKNLLKNYYGASLINTTENYAQVGKLIIIIKDNDIPVDSARVSFSVFNWGAFRGILSLYTDSTGIIEVDMGLTSILIGAEKDNKKAIKIIIPDPNEDKTIILNLESELNFNNNIQMFVP